MKTAELISSQSHNSAGWLDRLARTLMLKVLAGIQQGHLTIYDGQETISFGQSEKTAKVVAHIHVHNVAAYRAVLTRGTVGSGEAYMRGHWSSPDLVQVIRIFVINMDLMQRMDSRFSQISQWFLNIRHKTRRNSKENSRKNISAHYDLGNDLYRLFLDKSLMYSSAIFAHEQQTLDQASENKLRSICKKLKLKSTDHLLEIGTGWGGMAIYAARTTGCKVTTVTISQEQYNHAMQWVKEENLQDRVEVRLQDYRDISGSFDKIVSVEMIEAVGYQYFDTFFKKCTQLLKDDGLMLMQAITIADQRYEQEKDNADFIQTYIFPGGCLPSISTLCNSMTRASDMQLVQTEEIGLHYARTLALWKQRFFAELDAVKKLGYDDVFIRMWDFYLSYCEGGFLERVIGTSQLVFAKPRCMDLPS